MTDKEKQSELRKTRWIITGDVSLNGLPEDVANSIVKLLTSCGKSVECSTEYHYRDRCRFRGQVSTDFEK